MIKTIMATFTHGVFQPLEKVDYPEDKKVKITIEDEEDWSELAYTSFAHDWENEKDTIYDNWKRHYNVS